MPISRIQWQALWRVDSFQMCLSRDERAFLQVILDPKVTAQGVERFCKASSDSDHLDRWQTWKLDPAKITQLTSDTAICDRMQRINAEFFPPNQPMRFFARGKRGLLYSGQLRGQEQPQQQVVVKFSQAKQEANVDVEVKWLRILNRFGIGAPLLASGNGWFMCERISGVPIVSFLSQCSRSQALWVVREVLFQCFLMDSLGINKEEMTHPNRHLLVHVDDQILLKCTFIDFEKCAQTSKPKNVTQICQFLCSPRVTNLLAAKGILVNVSKLRQSAKIYKQLLPSSNLELIVQQFQ